MKNLRKTRSAFNRTYIEHKWSDQKISWSKVLKIKVLFAEGKWKLVTCVKQDRGWRNAQRLKDDVTKIEGRRCVRSRRWENTENYIRCFSVVRSRKKTRVRATHVTVILSYIVARVLRFIFRFLYSANCPITYSIVKFLLRDFCALINFYPPRRVCEIRLIINKNSILA